MVSVLQIDFLTSLLNIEISLFDAIVHGSVHYVSRICISSVA